MRKRDVEIGAVYVAKVSNKLTRVRIESEHFNKGWWAVNLTTGRRIHIRTAGRLRRRVTEPRRDRDPITSPGNAFFDNPPNDADAELAFEMRAVFGEGANVVNILTGERYRT